MTSVTDVDKVLTGVSQEAVGWRATDHEHDPTWRIAAVRDKNRVISPAAARFVERFRERWREGDGPIFLLYIQYNNFNEFTLRLFKIIQIRL